MILSLPAALALAQQCAPAVAPETLLSVVQVESGFNALAIGVNGKPRVVVRPQTRSAARAQAAALIQAGRSIDLGLGQINSGNLAWLGLSVDDAFDPCRNLAAADHVLRDGYRRAQAATSDPQVAVRTALSYYNTGHPRRGFDNGYVAKVTQASTRIVPAIAAGSPTRPTPAAAPSEVHPAPPPGDVFGQANTSAGFVLSVSTPTSGGQE